jgi:hypothetical protein
MEIIPLYRGSFLSNRHFFLIDRRNNKSLKKLMHTMDDAELELRS